MASVEERVQTTPSSGSAPGRAAPGRDTSRSGGRPHSPGDVIRLRAGEYEAVVGTTGGALISLRHRGRDLVRYADDEPPMPPYRGAVLAPWPNRIANGRYHWGGERHQLPLNEVSRGCALHGLLLWSTWLVVDAHPDSVELTEVVWPRPGYPWMVEVHVRYALDPAEGLRIRVRACNRSLDRAPWGVAVHPYLVAGPGHVDDWTLMLPADSFVDVDPHRLLPREQVTVAGTRFDFRAGRRIARATIDHAFGGLAFDEDHTVHATVLDPDGRGVRMTWDDSCRWVQVYTTELPGHPLHRTALALEPMTCPPDAFNSGAGVVALDPGEVHEAVWQIEAVEPGG
jgi:aldose 1-epimerase